MSDQRPETGAMKFGEDWTGIFIRGDDAIAYGMWLSALLKSHAPLSETGAVEDVIALMNLKSLAEMLLSSEEGPQMMGGSPPAGGVQTLKVFGECRSK